MTSQSDADVYACDMASKYERSLRNPYSRPLVGVPTFVPIQTKKASFRTSARIQADFINTVPGGGFKILWMPHAGCVNDVDAFRLSNFNILSGSNRTNSPFTASQLGDGLRARLVSARMTVCGVDAENDGILVAGAFSKDASQYTIADMMSRLHSKHLAIGRTIEDMVHVNYVPRDADEREAFVDDANEGVFGGTRTITSTAYPARHVVAWQGQGRFADTTIYPWNSRQTPTTLYEREDVNAASNWHDSTDGMKVVRVNGPTLDLTGNASTSWPYIWDYKYYWQNTNANEYVQFNLQYFNIKWNRIWYNGVRNAIAPKSVKFYVKQVGFGNNQSEVLVHTVTVSSTDVANATSGTLETEVTAIDIGEGEGIGQIQYLRVVVDQWWVGTGFHDLSGHREPDEFIGVYAGTAYNDNTLAREAQALVGKEFMVTVDSNWEFVGDTVNIMAETTTPAMVRPIRESTLDDCFVTPLKNKERIRIDLDSAAQARTRRGIDDSAAKM